MSEEQLVFYGVHVKVMCRTEEQYKTVLKILTKMGCKCSWTQPLKDDATQELYGFVNFLGSNKYVENYAI